ncbi:MAG: hypothetical protein A3K59_08340 [Euryarchaeota archaeon RBG_19FT_COMBO_69_17]|nr:MAG: hypothetical protein A3K59_08340 [Euryarchaeota archaeon RBG_19FT_COMBO_69_17]
MSLRAAYAASRPTRAPPSLPFGWGAVTVLLVGGALTIIGVVIILFGFFGMFGWIGGAVEGSFSIGSFFSSFFGAVVLFVVGGMIAGVGGWLVRLWWIFLFVGVVTGAAGGANTVREREAMRGGDVRVRCRACGRLNPEDARFCLSCGQAV